MDRPRYGVLLCINGTGILNRWLKEELMGSLSYEQMNELARRVPIGCEGLSVLPFGNGSERVLSNQDIGASIHGLNFNSHQRAHLLRAAHRPGDTGYGKCGGVPDFRATVAGLAVAVQGDDLLRHGGGAGLQLVALAADTANGTMFS